MTIKKMLVIASLLLGMVTVILIIAIAFVTRSEKLMINTERLSHISSTLATELRDSSLGLTSAIEKFVLTGNEQYADEYYDIILIRSGVKPRPDNRTIEPSQSISLADLMRLNMFTEQELALFLQAGDLSDARTSLEIRAMNARRGLFPDQDGQYTVIGEPDQELAEALIFNPEYEAETAVIMQTIELFYQALNDRLNSDVAVAQTHFNRSIRIVWIVLVLFVVYTVLFMVWIDRVILRPIIMCDTYAKQVTQGHFDSGLHYEKHNEIGSLASSLRAMVQSLLERMHLEEHARYFDAVIASADSGVIIADENYQITDWNAGAEAMIGYTVSEVIGKSPWTYTPESEFSDIKLINARLRKGERVSRVETVKRHKNGRLIDCSASYSPIIDKDGNFKGILAIFQDITEAKQAAKKARKLAAIVAMADAGVVVKDHNGIVTEWNIGAESILGYKSDEIIGKSTHYYAPEESWPRIDEVEACLRARENIVREDVLRKRKDGSLIVCSSSYTPIFDDAGNYTGSVAVFHDISDKKQMEIKLQEALNIAEEKHQSIMESIDYASKIQRNLLPSNKIFKSAFSDYSIIWSQKDTVGGDIYWIKEFDEGVLISVCDCTGHGTPGALLTMLVVSTLGTIVNTENSSDPAEILFQLDERLANALNANTSARRKKQPNIADIKDGCDIAVLFVAKDSRVTLSSANMHLFVCDGEEVTQIKGQKLSIGEGNLKSKDDVNTITIHTNPNNKFYVASDGLYDQIGEKTHRPFGYKMLKQIILEHHQEEQAVISEKIWEAFESHRGGQTRRDDVELITFKP